jgi:putative ABC transport system ATP-binding protein
MTPPVLEASDAWLEYAGAHGPLTALRGVNLVLEEGEFLGVMGPSGSGKSSLLFLLAGLRHPSRGRVVFRGAEWHPDPGQSSDLRRRQIGLVFSEPFLLPYLTVRENVLLQALPDVPPDRLDGLARAIGMRDLLDERPPRLSAGERHRASVLRALINSPVLVLADEPTAHLDQEVGRSVMRALQGVVGRTSLVVASHDKRMLAGATRVYTLDDGVLV